MKKGLVAILLLLFVSSVAAQAISNPGILPGNILYGLDRTMEKIQSGLSGQGIPRARIYMLFADERLAEANALLDKNKNSRVEEMIIEYEDNIAKSNIELDKARSINLNLKPADLQREVNLERNVAVLELILTKAPDSAKPAIERALKNARENTATLKERNKKAGIFPSITGANVILTQEELAQKEEQLRKKEEELNQREEELKGKGLISITGFAVSQEDELTLLKQRMGIIFLITIIGTFIYFYYIFHFRHQDLIKKRK